MMRLPLPRWLPGTALALWLSSVAPARAKDLPTYSVRELAIRATNVVLAEPLDPVEPTRCRVLEVLRGAGLRAGDRLTLADVSPHELRSYQEGPAPARKLRPRRISQVLLFLGPNPGTR